MKDNLNELAFDERLSYVALKYLQYEGKGTVLPEMILLLKSDQLMDFIEIFGGENVKVPSRKEFARSLHVITSIFLREYKNYSWGRINDILGLDGRALRHVKNKAEEWKKHLEREEVNLNELYDEEEKQEK